MHSNELFIEQKQIPIGRNYKGGAKQGFADKLKLH